MDDDSGTRRGRDGQGPDHSGPRPRDNGPGPGPDEPDAHPDSNSQGADDGAIRPDSNSQGADNDGTRPDSNSQGADNNRTPPSGNQHETDGTDAPPPHHSDAQKPSGDSAPEPHEGHVSAGDEAPHTHEPHELPSTTDHQPPSTPVPPPPAAAPHRRTHATNTPGTPRTPRPRAGTPDAAHRQARWEQYAEIPLAVASLAFLAAYALRVLAPRLPPAALDLCLAVTLAAWALFAVDYAVRWHLSGQRLGFVRKHVLDTLVLLLPLLRPLRVVKVYEAVQRRHGRPRLALHARVIAYSGLSTLLLGFTGALAVYQQERDAPGTTMPTFGDAVWWACATLTTVGYGDVTPVTSLGRLIAVGVMMIGLGLLGAVTGTFASWLLQTFSREDDERPPGS